MQCECDSFFFFNFGIYSHKKILAPPPNPIFNYNKIKIVSRYVNHVFEFGLTRTYFKMIY